MTGFSRPVVALIAVLIFAAGIALGWFGRGGGALPDDVSTIVNYDGWRLACPAASQKDKPCVISNDLVDSKTQRTVAQLTIVPTKSGTVLAVTAPFDVLLTAGVGLALGNDKPRLYPYLVCTGGGCIARIPLDDAMRTEMTQATQAKILFANLNRKAVAIEFSLKGFARANAASKDHQNKHSFLGMAS